MCDSLTTYNTIKDFTDIAAPTITIFSALLGLFTKTRDEVVLTINGKDVKKEYLTNWAWWSLGGIMLGGAISIWAALNDRKIDVIEDCIKAEKDSIYNVKVDSVNRQLEISRDTLTAILKTSAKTITQLNKSYEKQLLGLDKQNTLLGKTENLLHPFSPVKAIVRIEVEISDTLKSQINNSFRNLFQGGVRKPSFVSFDGSKLQVGFHLLQDTIRYSKEFISFEEEIKNILPEPSILFYSDNNLQRNLKSDRNEVFEIDGRFPYFIGKNLFSSSIKYLLGYEYYPSANLIKCNYLIEPASPISFGNDLKSLYAIKDGSIIIQIDNKFITGAESHLKYIILKCGEPPENYMANFYRNDIIRTQKGNLVHKTYHKPVISLINGTDISGLDLLTGN